MTELLQAISNPDQLFTASKKGGIAKAVYCTFGKLSKGIGTDDEQQSSCDEEGCRQCMVLKWMDLKDQLDTCVLHAVQEIKALWLTLTWSIMV